MLFHLSLPSGHISCHQEKKIRHQNRKGQLQTGASTLTHFPSLLMFSFMAQWELKAQGQQERGFHRSGPQACMSKRTTQRLWKVLIS